LRCIVPVVSELAAARNLESPSPRDAADGTVAMEVCNAVVGALKRSCGKGPTKVKASGGDDHFTVVAEDTLTMLERTLVQSGHDRLVHEVRSALLDEVADDCRTAIEQATGRRVVAWQTRVDPSADRAVALVQLEPLLRVAEPQD
jgi:uncharacterized protein YbcI